MNDPLFSNKLAAAGLTALLLFFGLPQIADALIGGGHHGKGGALHLAYPIEFMTTSGGAAETGDAASFFDLLAAASPAAGERRAALCKSCHTFEKGGANGAGPNLWNLVNRPVGSVSGFSYSAALRGDGGKWSYDRLDKYLENSQGYISGTSMVQRFPKVEQRAELIAYLRTLADSPVPMPEVPATAQ